MVKLFTTANSKNNKDILSDFSSVKTGWYLMKLVKDKWVENKNKTGSYVAMRFKIIGSKYNGKIIYANVNLKHKNKKVVKIANKFVNTLSMACGKKNVGDTKFLLDIIVFGFVVEKIATKTQPAGNEIKNFKKATKKDILKQKQADKKRFEEPDEDDEIEDEDDEDIFEDDEIEDEDDEDIFEDEDEEEENDDDELEEDDEEEEEKSKKKMKSKKKKAVKPKKKKAKNDDDEDEFPPF